MADDALVDAAVRVAAARSGSGSGNDLVAALRVLGELRRMVDAEGVRLAAELDRACDPGGPDAPDRSRGFAGAAALIQAETGIERSEAIAWVHAGRATAPRTELTGAPLPPVRPLVADALHAGTIGAAAADAIASALSRASRMADAGELDAFEHALVEAAPLVPLRQLRGLCRHVLDVVNPDGSLQRDEELRRRASVTIRPQPDGMTRLVAELHPEAAGYVIAALDARTAPRRRLTFAEQTLVPVEDGTDRRPLAERRVEALVGIARDALSHDAGHVAAAPVTVMVTVGLRELLDGLGTARISGVDEPISAASARRLAADARIIPVVLGGRSEILNQGREFRVATPAQRRALDLRDRGCLWTGCDAPPGWCEVAHLVPWMRGGPTDLENLALLCPFHHRIFDADRWELLWRDGIPWLIPPPHVDHLRTPMRAGKPVLRTAG